MSQVLKPCNQLDLLLTIQLLYLNGMEHYQLQVGETGVSRDKFQFLDHKLEIT